MDFDYPARSALFCRFQPPRPAVPHSTYGHRQTTPPRVCMSVSFTFHARVAPIRPPSCGFASRRCERLPARWRFFYSHFLSVRSMDSPYDIVYALLTGQIHTRGTTDNIVSHCRTGIRTLSVSYPGLTGGVDEAMRVTIMYIGLRWFVNTASIGRRPVVSPRLDINRGERREVTQERTRHRAPSPVVALLAGSKPS
jgi:small basic protein